MALTIDEIFNKHAKLADDYSTFAKDSLKSAGDKLKESDLFKYTPKAITIPTAPLAAGIPQPQGLPAANGGALSNGINSSALVRKTGQPKKLDPWASSVIGEAPDIEALDTSEITFTYEKPEDFDPKVTPLPTLDFKYVAPIEPSWISLDGISADNLPIDPASIRNSIDNITKPEFDDHSSFIPSSTDLNALAGVNQVVPAMQGEMSVLRQGYVAPKFNPEDVERWVNFFAPNYHEIRASVDSVVLDYDGGNGIPAQIEAAIMERHAARVNEEATRGTKAALRDVAARGYTIPNGAFLSQVNQARFTATSALVAASTELAAKNMELEQKYRELVVNVATQIDSRLNDVARSAMDFTIRIEEAKLNAYKQMVDVVINKYRMELEAHRMVADIVKAKVDLYKAMLEADGLVVNLYSAQLKGEETKMHLNDASVSMWKAMVEAYVAQVQGYKAEIDAELAGLEADKGRLAQYESALKAKAFELQFYQSQIESEKARMSGVQLQASALELKAKTTGLQVEAFKYKVDAMGREAEAKSQEMAATYATINSEIGLQRELIQAAVSAFMGGEVEAFKANANAQIANIQAQAEVAKANNQAMMQSWSVQIQTLLDASRADQNVFEAKLNAGMTGIRSLTDIGNIAGNLASSSMSGITSFAGAITQGA